MPCRPSHFRSSWASTTRGPESTPATRFHNFFHEQRPSATTTRTMAEDNYRDYLVARVVTEQKPITYRLLSRVLKTNVNTAKRSVQSVQLFECELT